jgi:hypothetical protein
MLAGPLAAEDGVGVTGTVHDIEHGSGTGVCTIGGVGVEVGAIMVTHRGPLILHAIEVDDRYYPVLFGVEKGEA